MLDISLSHDPVRLSTPHFPLILPKISNERAESHSLIQSPTLRERKYCHCLENKIQITRRNKREKKTHANTTNEKRRENLNCEMTRAELYKNEGKCGFYFHNMKWAKFCLGDYLKVVLYMEFIFIYNDTHIERE